MNTYVQLDFHKSAKNNEDTPARRMNGAEQMRMLPLQNTSVGNQFLLSSTFRID